MRKIGVVLGRFAPLHKGHQKVIDEVISDFGIKNTLLIVGSSNSYNIRTPYSFSQRKAMLRAIYPDVQIAGISDTNKKNEHFLSKDLIIWIKKLKAMQNKFKSEFVFYAGSSEDIYYLEKDFKIKIPVDRNKNSLKISATKIRELLDSGNYEELHKYLDPKITTMVITGYQKFKKSLHT